MKREAIWDTPEYKIASSEMQRWAFTHKGHYVSSEDAARQAGIKLDRKVKVKANNGEEVELPVKLNWHSISVDPKIPQAKISDGSRYHTVYMISGKSPKNKTAVYVTSDELLKSPDMVAFKQEVDDAFKKHKQDHHEMLKAELVKSLPAAAKKAANAIPELAKQDDAAEKIYDWFKSNGFDMDYMKPEDFKPYAKEVAKSGHVLTSWEITAKADGYGHQTGTSGEINFTTKKIGKHGWSSDD